MRRLLLSLVLYGLPAYLLSRFLMELNGGAMWVPDEWRRTMGLIGFGSGAAVFHLGRCYARDLSEGKGPVQVVRGSEQASGLSAEIEASQVAMSQDRFVQKRVLAAYALTVLFLVPHTVLRHLCIRDWTPSKAHVVGLYSNFQDRDSAEVIDSPELWSQVVIDIGLAREPLCLKQPETKEGPYAGSILLPVGFPHSQQAQQALDAFADRDPSRNPITQWLEIQPAHLADTIRDCEPLPYALTKLLFLLAHLAVLLAASAAYGLSFSLLGELMGSASPSPS